MPITSREYIAENDFTRIMKFLRETFQETGTLQNWYPDRFEGSSDVKESDIHIWEESDNLNDPKSCRIVAVANPESDFVYFIQIHPKYSFLEKEIIKWIEEHSKTKKKEEAKKERLRIITVEGNKEREKTLGELGFKKITDRLYGHLRFRDVNLPIPEISLPTGFKIRSVNKETDHEQLVSHVRLIFGHGDWFTPRILEWISQRSFYQRELDIVVEASNGTIAAFCTLRIDPKSRITQLEPLATHPDYRKMGIAKAMLNEGCRRLQKYNPSLLYIGGAANTPAACRLYDSVGFTEKFDMYICYKEI